MESEEKLGVLYKLVFSNGKAYIGITKHSASHRFRGHSKDVAAGKKTALHNAWRKYGPPTIEIISTPKLTELFLAEVEAIASQNTMTPNGYNSTPGGEVSPMLTKAIADKVGAKLLGRKNGPHKPSTIALMRLARLGKPVSEEAKAKISAAQKIRLKAALERKLQCLNN